MTDYGGYNVESGDSQGTEADPDVDEQVIRTHNTQPGEQRVEGVPFTDQAEPDGQTETPDCSGQSSLQDWEQA